MKKLVPILALLALAVAACGGGSRVVAATVDGAEISVGEVEDLLDPEGSTIAKEQFAQFLGFEIQWEIVRRAAEEEWGIVIDEEEIGAEADRIYEAANADETRDEFLSSRGVTEAFLANIAHQGLIDQAVRAALEDDVPPPSDEDMEAEMAVARAGLTQVCVSHILVDAEEEAVAVTERLEAGEEFGEIAVEVSQDPGSAANNGVLPCGPAGQYVPEFRDAAMVAPVGDVYDTIVETSFGFHILLVTDRVEAADADLPSEDEVSQALHAQAVAEALNTWFFAKVGAAEVTVDEEYGTWAPDRVDEFGQPAPTVVPPSE